MFYNDHYSQISVSLYLHYIPINCQIIKKTKHSGGHFVSAFLTAIFKLLLHCIHWIWRIIELFPLSLTRFTHGCLIDICFILILLKHCYEGLIPNITVK